MTYVAAALVEVFKSVPRPEILASYEDYSREPRNVIFCEECSVSMSLGGVVEDDPIKRLSGYCPLHTHLAPYTDRTPVRFASKSSLNAMSNVMKAFSGRVSNLPANNLGDELPSVQAGFLLDGRDTITEDRLVDELMTVDLDILYEEIGKLDRDAESLPSQPSKEASTSEQIRFKSTVISWKEKWVPFLVKAALHKGEYIKISFASSGRRGSAVMKLLDFMRTEEFVQWTENGSNKRESLLFLLGAAAKGTPNHLDWTEAYNVAFAVHGSNATRPLARWTFFHPSSVPYLDAWLKARGDRNGLKSHVLMQETDVSEFVEYLKHEVPNEFIKRVIVVKQYSGHRVHVPAGWAHQVVNLQACVKFAYDVYKPKNFRLYVEGYFSLGCKYFRQARDYMAVMHVLKNAAEACSMGI